MTRIFGMPTLALSFAIARNFSTKGRTFPGLQYMISRMRSMRVLPCEGWVQAAAGRLTDRAEAAGGSPARASEGDDSPCSPRGQHSASLKAITARQRQAPTLA